jgi:hypothetical protein
VPQSLTMLLVALLALSFMTLGCTTGPVRQVEGDGRYCFKSSNHRFVCTTRAIPGAASEQAALTFSPSGETVTVYVIRSDWPDAFGHVPLVIDGQESVDTIPHSFARLELRPGPHSLSVPSRGGSATFDMDGKAGSLRFLRVRGNTSIFPPDSYRLEEVDARQGQRLTLNQKFVSEVRLH